MSSNQTTSPTRPPIVAEALVRHFGSGDDLVRAVDGVDLQVEAGEIFGFLGPNGAGKSTTVRMLTTLLRPTSGTATVAGFDVVQQADQVRRSIGVALQDAAIDPLMTGTELLQPPSRALRPAEGDPPLAGRRVARAGRVVGCCRSEGWYVLGWDATAPRPGDVADPRTVRAVPRRADDRSRSDEPALVVGGDPTPQLRRRHGVAHDPVPRGSRSTRRPCRDHRSRTDRAAGRTGRL